MMIKISKLCKSYGKYQALKDVDLDIKDGSVMGLIGINGAGKSTLLRLISNIYEIDSGSILFDNISIKENSEIKKDLFFLPDEPFYTIHDTAVTILNIYKEFYNLNEEVYYDYLKKFSIPLDKKMNNFSKGMKRQVFISLAFSIQPKYLLLDEAFDGLDPVARLIFKQGIVDLVETKETTVIISSHSLRELEDICDCYALIDNKTIAFSGDLIESLSTYHKYHVGFNVEPRKEDFDFEIVSYTQDKRIATFIVKMGIDEFKQKIDKFEPLLIDEIRIDFEELFILEIQNRGYLKWLRHLHTF